MNPVIGIVACGFYKNRQFVSQPYIRAVERAGGGPLVLPYVREPSCFPAFARLCGGFLFCGGGDINPLLLQDTPVYGLGNTDYSFDRFQLSFMKYLLRLHPPKPILAICRGMQVMNVSSGGSIIQHLQPPAFNHMQTARRRSDPWHKITIKKGSLLHSVLGDSTEVNSYHHQAILKPGEGFHITAAAPDGVPEAIELAEHPFALGVQWHPECMPRSPGMRRLFQAFIQKGQ